MKKKILGKPGIPFYRPPAIDTGRFDKPGLPDAPKLFDKPTAPGR